MERENMIMYQLLKTLRFISIIGSITNIFLLLLNLSIILIFNSLEHILALSWKSFFIITMITLISSILGYFLHGQKIKIKKIFHIA